MSLSPAEADLAWLAARPSSDESLVRLLRLAEYAGISVSVIVDGVLLAGELASPVEWAAHLDASVEHAIASAEAGFAEGAAPAGWNEVIGAMRANPMLNSALSGNASRQRLIDEIARVTGGERRFALEDLPPDLARRYIAMEAPPATLTLKNADVGVPGGERAFLGMVRVLTSSIGAWWPGRPA